MKKRFLSMVLCMVLVASLFTGFVSTASADDVIPYTVHDGDYLFKICKANGLDYYQCKNAIMVLNGFTTETQLNRLTVGQLVKLPASNAIASTVKASSTTTTAVTTTTTINGTTTTTTSTSTMSGNLSNYKISFYLIPHAVQYGETLAGICNMYGSSYPQYASMILSTNNISSANNVWAGKTVYIPSTKAPNAGGFYAVVSHVVSSGETMTSICNNYGTSYTANANLIKGLNGGKNLNTIYAGQTLNIPIASSVISNNNVVPGPVPTSVPVSTGYQISFNNPDNGDPYAVVGSASYVERAEAGTTVTVIPNANSGYTMKSIKVTRTDSNTNVQLDGTTFTMPESNVSIVVTYAKGLEINKEASVNGSFYAMVNGESVTTCKYGDKIVLKFSPKAGYSVDKVSYAKKGTSTYTTLTPDDETGEYSLFMPNYSIKLKVTFVYSTYHTLTYTKTGQGSVVFTNENGEAVTKAIKGTKITATAAPAGGWILHDENSFALAGTTKEKKVNDSVKTFVVGDVDVTATVAFDNKNAYSLFAEQVEGGFVLFVAIDKDTGAQTGGAKTAKPGDKVTIVPYPSNGYKYDISTRNHVTAASGTVISVDGADTFTMPEANIRVVPVFSKDSTKQYHSITSFIGDIHGAVRVYAHDGSAWTESVRGITGNQVMLKYIDDVNYAIVSAMLYDPNGVSGCGTPDANGYVALTISGGESTFNMPDVDTNVILTYQESYQQATIKSTAVWADGSAISSPNPFREADATKWIRTYVNGQEITGNTIAGSMISLGYELCEGYSIDKVTVERYDASDAYVGESELYANNGVYSYAVKSSDVSLVFKAYVKENKVTTFTATYSNPAPANGDYNIRQIRNGSVIADTNSNVSGIKEGDVIVLVIKPNGSAKAVARVVVDEHDVTSEVIKDGESAGVHTYEFVAGAKDYVTRVEFKDADSEELHG